MIYAVRIRFKKPLSKLDLERLCGGLYNIDEDYSLEYSEIKPAIKMKGKVN